VYCLIVGSDEEVVMEAEVEQLTESVERVAALLGIGRATAYRAVHRGEIPSIRVGRRYLVPREALRRLLRGDGTPAIQRG
jgi:excisionase family DNA binding protein